MKLHRLILLGLVAIIQACGFQLRGFASLPDHISHLYLEVDDLTTSQKQHLIQQLKHSGATLYFNADSNVARLRVSLKSLPEHNLVDSAGSGHTIVRLSRQLNYSLTDSSGDRLADNEALVSKLDLELNDNNLLGTEGEKQASLENIDSALFNSLMIQLRRF